MKSGKEIHLTEKKCKLQSDNFTLLFLKYTICTKKKRTSKKSAGNHKKVPKVIHIKKCGNIEKKELYTKLYTLSTEKRRKI